MTTEWARFWAAIAAIVIAGAATTYANLGRAWEIGSLGEWVSGGMAGAAIVAALHIAGLEAKRSRLAIEEQRAYDLEQRRQRDIGTLKAIMTVFGLGFLGLKPTLDRMAAAPNVAPGWAQTVIDMEIFEHLKSDLRSINLTEADAVTLDLRMTAVALIAAIQLNFSFLAKLPPERHASITPEYIVGSFATNANDVIRQVSKLIRERGGNPWDGPIAAQDFGLTPD